MFVTDSFVIRMLCCADHVPVSVPYTPEAASDASRKRDTVCVLVPEASDVRLLDRGLRNARLVVEEPLPRLVWTRLARSAVCSPSDSPPPPPTAASKEVSKEKERECTTTTSPKEADCCIASSASTAVGEQVPPATIVPAPVACGALLWRGWPDAACMFHDEFKRMGFDAKHWQIYEDNKNYACALPPDCRSFPLRSLK